MFNDITGAKRIQDAKNDFVDWQIQQTEKKNQASADFRRQLEQNAINDKYENQLKNATEEILKLKNKNKKLEELLSRPLKEIAQENAEFKENYEILIEAQKEIIADWILSQKAYKETAMILGMQLGKTPEEIKKMAESNEDVVLNNNSTIDDGNNASSSKTLSNHAAKIIDMRKKNVKK